MVVLGLYENARSKLMTPEYPGQVPATAPTIYCTQCGQAMRVAPEHIQSPVACPHCRQVIEPWRIVEAIPRVETRPPPPGYGDDPLYRAGYSWRNRWIAGALGVLLGGCGVHRFYLGFTGIGILQIIITVVTFGVGAIWGFIEGILCFAGAIRDVDGRPLRD